MVRDVSPVAIDTQYSAVSWAFWRIKPTVTRLCVQRFVQPDIAENIKAPYFVQEISRWPTDSLTKGQ